VNRNRKWLIFLSGFGIIVLGLLGTFAYWRLRLAHEVNGRLQAIKSAGLPTSGAELDKWYAAVPDSDNAAAALRQAFGLVRTYPDSRSNEVARFKFPSRGQALTPQQSELLAGHVALNRAVFPEAEGALMLPKCRYPMDLAQGVQTPPPHLRQLRIIVTLAEEKALLASDASNPAEAASAVLLILGLARTLEDEPILISQLVRIGFVQTATITLERALNRNSFNEAQLKGLVTAFASAEKTNLISRALVGERALHVPYFRMSYTEIKRYSSTGDDGGDGAPSLPFSDRQPGIYRVSGFFERDLRLWLETFEGGIQLAALSPPQSLIATNHFEGATTNAANQYCLLSAMLMPSFTRAVVREAECLGHIRVARTALAVEQFRVTHGVLPQKLEDLAPQYFKGIPADPFDGGPLRYRLQKGYVVYSVYLDLHDDGGRERPERRKPNDQSTYDLTFTVER
jgi:hypothetical protein